MEISNPPERSNPTLKNPDLTEIENPSPPVVLPGMPGSDYDGAEHHADYESDCSVITSYSDVEQPTKRLGRRKGLCSFTIIDSASSRGGKIHKLK